MKNIDDWNFILNTVDELFYRLSNGIASRTGLSLEEAHEETWVLFENGYFKLVGTRDGVGVVPCHGADDRRAAKKQNKPLSDYRRRVIEEEVAAA